MSVYTILVDGEVEGAFFTTAGPFLAFLYACWYVRKMPWRVRIFREFYHEF